MSAIVAENISKHWTTADGDVRAVDPSTTDASKWPMSMVSMSKCYRQGQRYGATVTSFMDGARKSPWDHIPRWEFPRRGNGDSHTPKWSSAASPSQHEGPGPLSGQEQPFAPLCLVKLGGRVTRRTLKNRMRTRPERYRPVQGMIGTAEIAFIGEPSSTRLLIAM